MIQKDDKRQIWSWAMYDFANSAFATLVVTFIYGTYFTKSIADNEILGTQYWSWAISISAIVVALFSPLLGAIADNVGSRKRIMMLSTMICVVATALLFFPIKGQVLLALSLFIIANVAFEFGTVFCNSYLPELSSEQRIGKVSGMAWGLGYIGGLLALVVALIFFVQTEQPILGFSAENGEHIRATNLLVALWFLIFSLPLFIWVKDSTKKTKKPLSQVLTHSFTDLKKTFEDIASYRQIFRFLLARLVYNDALITIFAFGGIYAATTIGFSFEEIIILGIVLNVMAGIGAFAFGYLDDGKGSQKVIVLSIVFLMLACLIAFLAPELPGLFQFIFGGKAIPTWFNSKLLFWIAAILIGLFSGPNQSASRTYMARITPVEKRNEFFGFYAFSGKMTAFMGPFLFGLVTGYFETQQAGLIIVFILFYIGYRLMKRL
jgi:MFS transporter, UMF1 family